MVWTSKGTYRTVRRQATSEDTPASIKTSRPKPEPVPALPGPLCSAMVEIGCEAAMWMECGNSSCFCFPCVLALIAFSQSMSTERSCSQLRPGVSRSASNVEQKQHTSLFQQSRQLDSRCLFHFMLELCRVRDQRSSSSPSRATPQPLLSSVM